MTQLPEQEHIGSVAVGRSGEKPCPGADNPEERCPRHPSECTCWQIDPDHSMMKRTALSRPAQDPVAVKPLEWRTDRTAKAFGATWMVWPYTDPLNDGNGRWMWQCVGAHPHASGRFHTEAEAFAAAQDDYQQRLLSTLSAAPQPVINPTHSQVAGTPGLLTETAPSVTAEPVAWRVRGADGKWHSSTNKDIALHWEASGFEAVPLYAHPPVQDSRGPDVTMLLQSKAETIRTEYWLAYGKPCDCSTPDGALHYGRAQGLEMAADIIAPASEGSAE